MKKFVPLLLVFLIGVVISMWLPDLLNLGVSGDSWTMRVYRGYHMIWGGLFVLCIMALRPSA